MATNIYFLFDILLSNNKLIEKEAKYRNFSTVLLFFSLIFVGILFVGKIFVRILFVLLITSSRAITESSIKLPSYLSFLQLHIAG